MDIFEFVGQRGILSEPFSCVHVAVEDSSREV